MDSYMSKLSIVAIALLVCLLPSAVIAQTSSESNYLLQVDVPDSLYSEVLQEQRSYWVHLPGGRSLVEGQSYPVIYLLDGGVLLGGLAAIQEFYNQFRLPEMIVVGISNANNRTRDLTPSSIDSRHGASVQESGGSDRFMSFLADELIPLIDSQYPTTTHRVLIGHSYAGLFAVNTLVTRPDVFTNYVAIDPSLDWDDQRWMERTLSTLESSDLTGKGLFVSVANEIIRFSHLLTPETVMADTTAFSLGIRSLLLFVTKLKSTPPKGLRFDWKYYPQDIHGSVPLVGMRDALVSLYDFWELKTPSLYNNPETPTGELLALIRNQSSARSTNMGYPQPMEEELLDMLAFMSLDAGQPDKARAILELTAGYYPTSSSIHESIMEVCLTTEDYDCAQTHAAEADRIEGGTQLSEKVMEARKSR